MPPLTDILFGSAADGSGMGSGDASGAMVKKVRPVAAGSGVTKMVLDGAVVPPPSGYTLTAGLIDPSVFGMDVPSGVGSVSPATYSGSTIRQISSDTVASIVFLVLSGVQIQSFFTTFDFDGTILLSASANSFFISGGHSFWRWNGVAPISSIGSYSVDIT